jgi:hypothetical protein
MMEALPFGTAVLLRVKHSMTYKRCVEEDVSVPNHKIGKQLLRIILIIKIICHFLELT